MCVFVGVCVCVCVCACLYTCRRMLVDARCRGRSGRQRPPPRGGPGGARRQCAAVKRACTRVSALVLTTHHRAATRSEHRIITQEMLSANSVLLSSAERPLSAAVGRRELAPGIVQVLVYDMIERPAGARGDDLLLPAGLVVQRWWL